MKINTPVPNKSQGWCRVSAPLPGGPWEKLPGCTVTVPVHGHGPFLPDPGLWPASQGGLIPAAVVLSGDGWLPFLGLPGPDPFLAPSWPCLVTMGCPGDLGPQLPPWLDTFTWTWGWSPRQGPVLITPPDSAPFLLEWPRPAAPGHQLCVLCKNKQLCGTLLFLAGEVERSEGAVLSFSLCVLIFWF